MSVVSYKVLVYTANEHNAGTNANVFITLYGTEYTSSECPLDNAHNNFEQGDTDEFTLKLARLGQINKVSIRHDNSGLAAGWLLEKIVIDNEKNADEGPWTFLNINETWLDGDGNGIELGVAGKKVETT